MKWKVDENKELPVAVIEDTEDGFGICELDGGGTASRDELEKIARLIAAAPDLLAALEMTLREWYPRLDGCIRPDCLICARRKKEMQQVEAVIAKTRVV